MKNRHIASLGLGPSNSPRLAWRTGDSSIAKTEEEEQIVAAIEDLENADGTTDSRLIVPCLSERQQRRAVQPVDLSLIIGGLCRGKL
jgi:hypothetical protein